jgi:Tol biopolymer transport system component
MMKWLFFSALFLTCILDRLVAQPVRLKLSRQVNVPNFNHYAPSLSADGQTLLFASDYYCSDGNKVELKITESKGVDNWGALGEVTIINKSANLNQHGGHCVSADGNVIYFSSRKMGGVGGFDIWMSEKIKGVWSAPQNLGKPVNSEGMEAFPSLSPDGKQLYFVRCPTMTDQKCEGGKVYVAELKGKGIWKEPILLPSSINQGNVLSPKIAKDSKTLFFSSDKPGGKGGYDVYVSKKNSDEWSSPRNVAPLNTSSDEIFADMSIQTDAITYASLVEGNWTLFKAKLAEEFQPEATVLFTGKVVNTEKKPLSNALVQLFDNRSGTPLSLQPVAYDGKFAIVLEHGKSYDVSIKAGNENFYWSSTLSSENLTRSKREEMEAVLEPLSPGKFYQGNKALFDSASYSLLPGASWECKRIAKVLESHPAWKIELVLFASGIAENPPADEAGAFNSMKSAMQAEMGKTGLPSDKWTISNGVGTAEEESNYSGWGIKISQ